MSLHISEQTLFLNNPYEYHYSARNIPPRVLVSGELPNAAGIHH